MMAKRTNTQIKMHFCTIEMLMPQEHFLRDIAAAIDFEFIYEKVSHLYSAVGRPSIDPVVIVKTLLLGYLYGEMSERKLMSEIQVNIAYRWFLGIDLDEPVPNHSTLSQLRRRKFNNSRLFEDIFDEIVKKRINVGLVTGEVLLTDSTHIRANAANDKRETIIVQHEPSEYMKKLDEMALADGLIKESAQPKTGETKEITQSTTDADCGLMNRPGKPTGFHYLNHQTIDGGSGIITDVFVTSGNTLDHQHHAARINYQVDKFGLATTAIGGDAGYDVPEVHAEMYKRGIKTYIPRKASSAKELESMFPREAFEYNHTLDAYICPIGCLLSFSSFRKGRGVKRYQSRASDCRDCPLKVSCIAGKGKIKCFERSYHWTEYEKQHENDKTERYLEVQKLRKIWCEDTFAHQKARHCLTRAKMRGIAQVSEQCLLSACAVNLKRMIATLKTPLPASYFIKNLVLHTIARDF
ncbi:MAG: transposase [Oscillospiraceae bacterium]|nr:transposase [Oscillospiraceae bacterium]